MLFDSNTLSTNTGMSGTAQPDVTMNVTTLWSTWARP